jgi:hypothetical protein
MLGLTTPLRRRTRRRREGLSGAGEIVMGEVRGERVGERWYRVEDEGGKEGMAMAEEAFWRVRVGAAQEALVQRQ